MYHAGPKSGGADCGYVYTSYKVYTYCQPGDYCTSSSQRKCKVVTTCGAGSIYHAYGSAGGAQCGYVYTSYKKYVYCKPMDSCSSSSQRKCKK